MLVTIDSLNKLNLEVNADNEEAIQAIVDAHERDYIDACLSPELSDVFKDDTKDEPRFKVLRGSSIVDNGVISARVKGLDYGVNYYVYCLWLLRQYQSATQSGRTVQTPKNSTQLDPRDWVNHLWQQALDASDGCIYIIETDTEETYPEYTKVRGLDTRSRFNF